MLPWLCGVSFLYVPSRSIVVRRWFRALDPTRVDWVVGAALLVGSEILIWAGSGHRDRVVAAIAVIVPSVAVAVRRRWLVEVLSVGVVIVTVKLAVWGTSVSGQAGGLGLVALMLIFYAIGAFYTGRQARLLFALGITVLLVSTLHSGGSPLMSLFLAVAIAGAPPWLLGRMARGHAERERTERERVERLDAEREFRVRAAALAERARLAREVHDVIAHSVSVMVIQAAGARTVMARDADRAEQSLRVVERAGREALAELRRLLGVLGDGESLRALAPQPGLEDLEELVSRTSAGGLVASIRVEGEPAAVSPGLSLCAYRVVQEALTNAIKHAGASCAQVVLRWSDDALELSVSDDGRGDFVDQSSRAVGGHGILGMRERIALHGGTVEVGSASGGGFAVRASIPLSLESVA
jgi:signal transduction histidine kinase